MAKRYYWLKLPEDFFRQKSIKKLRKIAGGDTYTIIYLKMLLIAIKQDGKLFFEGVEDNFIDELALDLDEAPDDVQMTVQYLQNQGLMQLVNGTEYELEDCSKMTGSESSSAQRMRRLREIQASQCDTDVTASDDPVTLPLHLSDVEIEKEIEIDKEIDKTICPEPCAEASSEPEPEPFITLPLNTGEEYPIFQSDIDEFAKLYPAVDVPQAMRDMRGWSLTNPTRRKTKKGIKRFMNSWLSKEQDRDRGPKRNEPNTTKKNSFNNFSQRQYDWNEIEQKLITPKGG